MQRRLVLALTLTLPLMVLAMSAAWRMPVVGSALLTAAVVFGAGRPLLARGLSSLRTRQPDMFLLISVGVLVAYVASLSAALLGRTATHLYFETAAALTTLTLLGQVLELRARRLVDEAVGQLESLLPALAHRMDEDGHERDITTDQVRTGDRLRVRPGEALPADGIVIDGQARLDESLLSGEASPVDRGEGQRVMAATVNHAGSFLMSVTGTGQYTVLAGIGRLTESARQGRPAIARLADRVSARFVPAVLAMAALTATAWWTLGGQEQFWLGLVSAISVVIIACPCALGLATPMSVAVGTGLGARMGVLFRDIEALERLGEIDVVVIDKTGTLTEGRPSVESFKVTDRDESRCLALAASVEAASEHPVARALVRLAESRDLGLRPVESFRADPGRGAEGSVDGVHVSVGNLDFVAERTAGEDGPTRLAALEAGLGSGQATRAFIAIDGRPAAVATFTDKEKPGSREAVDMLTNAGLEIVLASGDSRGAVDRLAGGLGISTRHASVSPAGKARLVERLRAGGKRVAMAGDGVNDAPALAASDVGIAMGTGTGMAIAASAVTLVRGDLRAVARAVHLSRATMRNIRQNLAFAFGYNALALPLAAGVLYPVWGLALDPMVASITMSLRSISVIANALRLRRAAV